MDCFKFRNKGGLDVAIETFKEGGGQNGSQWMKF
jgi:hypothetical protein